MLTAVLWFTLFGSLFGLGLGWAARRFRVESDPVVERIDAITPPGMASGPPNAQ